MDYQGIQHRKVTAKWPQANGEVERQNRSLLKRIQIAQAERKDWKKELNVYLASYRTLPHPTTGQVLQNCYPGGKYGHDCQNFEMYMLNSKYEIEIMNRKIKVKYMLITRERHVIQILFRVIKC